MVLLNGLIKIFGIEAESERTIWFLHLNDGIDALCVFCHPLYHSKLYQPFQLSFIGSF